MTKFLFLAITFVALVTTPVTADVLIEWKGTEGSTQSKSFERSGFSSDELERGPGVTEVTGTGLFTSEGFESDILGSFNNDRFLSFGFSLDPGYVIDVTNIRVALERESGIGPDEVYLFDSINGFGSALNDIDFQTFSTGIVQFNLSSIGYLQDFTGDVEFRMYFAGGSSTAGDLSVATDIGGLTGNVGLQVNGLVTAPEPGSSTLIGIFAMSGIAFFRRRR